MKLVLILIFLAAVVQGFDATSTYQSFCTLIYRKPCKELTKEQQKLVVSSLMKHNPDEHLEYYTELLGKYDDVVRDLEFHRHLIQLYVLQDRWWESKYDAVPYRCPNGTCVENQSDCDLN